MNKLIDSIFWAILGIFWVVCLVGADTPTNKIVPNIWVAAITVIFVIKTATLTILTALKEQSTKKEN